MSFLMVSHFYDNVWRVRSWMLINYIQLISLQVLYEGCSIVKFVDAPLDSGTIDMSIMYITDLVICKKDHIF
jgi:hypothetical protein